MSLLFIPEELIASVAEFTERYFAPAIRAVARRRMVRMARDKRRFSKRERRFWRREAKRRPCP